MMLKLPVPQRDFSQYETELDERVFTLVFRYAQPLDVDPFYTLDILDGNNTPLYEGVKLVSGARLCTLAQERRARRGS